MSDVDFPSYLSKSVNPYFRQYLSDRNSEKFICCQKIQSKNAEIVSISTVKRLDFNCVFNQVLYGFVFNVQFKYKLQWEHVCFKLNFYKREQYSKCGYQGNFKALYFFTRRFHTHKKHKTHTTKQNQKDSIFMRLKTSKKNRRRKSLVSRFVLIVLFMPFMLFMCIKNI